MNLDAPEDRVHTALSQALFEDHPLGREVSVRCRRSRRSPATTSRRSSGAGTGPPPWWSPPPAASITPRWSTRCTPASTGWPAASGRPGRAVGGGGARGRRARRHRAGPPQPRVAQPHQPGRRPLCAVGRQPVLGGGMASRLFQEVRRSAAWRTPCTRTPPPSRTPATSPSTAAPPPSARETLAVIDEVLARSSPTASPTASGRRGRLPRGLDAPRPRGQRQPHGPPRPHPHQRDDIMPIDEVVARVRAVTTDDVSRVLHRVLNSPRTLAAVGPFEGPDELVA